MHLSLLDRLCHPNTRITLLDTPNIHHRVVTLTSTTGAEVLHTSPARRGTPIIMTCTGEAVVQEVQEEDPDQVGLLCKVTRHRRCHHSNNSNNTHRIIITTTLILLRISTLIRHIRMDLGTVLLLHRIKGHIKGHPLLVLVGCSTMDVVGSSSSSRIPQEDSGRPRLRGRVTDTLHILRGITATILDLLRLTRDTLHRHRYKTDPRCRTIRIFRPDLSLRWARFPHGKTIRGPGMVEGAIIRTTIGGRWTLLIHLAEAGVQKDHPPVD